MADTLDEVKRSRALGISSRASPKRSTRTTGKRRKRSRASRPPLRQDRFRERSPTGSPGATLPSPPKPALAACLTLDAATAAFPDGRRRSDGGSHGRRGGLRRLPRFRRALAWDRVGVADFVLWEGMFSEQKSVPKKYLERKFSFWSRSSAG